MKSIVLALFVLLTAAGARADDLGLTFSDFPDKFHRAGARLSLKERLVKQSCDSKARTVCTYKLGDFMMVMASAKGDDPIAEITMICATGDAPENIRSAAKCMVAYSSAISATSPDRDVKERATILKVLLGGLDVGETITIKADDRKFIMQKSMGLWFHIVSGEK